MQTITVDMTPGFRQPTIHYSQNDVGTTFAIDLRSRFGDTLPASPTVKIQATKPSGFGFSIEADSVVDSVATFTTVATMTDEAGRFLAELEVSDSGVVLYTANFYMEGEANPHPIGTTDGQQETVIPTLTLLVERVEAAAASVLDMEVNATTLAAGSQASYSYDEATNTATFGIPQGEAGAGAAGVTASAYSSSKTYAVGDYVIHNSNLYRCTTAITTAEAFTAAHWTQVVLGDDVTDLKSDFTNISGNNSISFVKDKYINTSGDTVDITSPTTSSSGLGYAVVDASEGDLFTITGSGASNGRLWCFIKSNGDVLAKAYANSTANELVIEAPKDSAKLVINLYLNTNHFACYGKTIKEKQNENATDIQLTNDLLLPQHYTIKNEDDLSWELGTFTSSGQKQDSTTRIRCNFVNVKKGSVIKPLAGYKASVFELSESGTIITYRSITDADAIEKYVVENDCQMIAVLAFVGDNTISDVTDTYTNGVNMTLLSEKETLKMPYYPTKISFARLTDQGLIVPEGSNPTRVAISDFVPLKVGDTISAENGVKFNVARYSSPSTSAFVSYRTMSTDTYIVQVDGYFCFGMGTTNNDVLTDYSIVNKLIIRQSVNVEDVVLGKLSPFDKSNKYYYDDAPCSYYTGLLSEYNDLSFGSETFTTYFNKLDALVSGDSYVSKKTLGVDSDGYSIYEYILKAKDISSPDGFTVPKVLILAGNQGSERCSIFGLYYLIKDLVTNYQQSEILSYLRRNVELHIVPILSGWGFDNISYTNKNGVNVNRNFDTDNWTYIAPTDVSNYSGESPASEAETQVAQDWIELNRDAIAFIDFHTNGFGILDSWQNVNWHSLRTSSDAYYHRIEKASLGHLKRIQYHMIDEYNLPITVMSNNLGHISASIGATAKDYAYESGIVALTFEGNNGFPSDSTAGSPDTQKCNEELIANYLLSVLREYSK